jgi:hypothetical protein
MELLRCVCEAQAAPTQDLVGEFLRMVIDKSRKP